MESVSLVVTNPAGLHARPASVFSKQAAQYKSAVTLVVDDKRYNAKSIIKVLSAMVGSGKAIRIEADGEDEQAAVAGMKAAVESGLGE